MMYDRIHRNVNIKDDLRTFQELVTVGNSVNLNIQLGLDVPLLHFDGKLPILDLKVWVEDNQIRHIFYRREVAPSPLIVKESALSNWTKRDTLFQKSPRILKNCVRTAHLDVIRSFLAEFAYRMRTSP